MSDLRLPKGLKTASRQLAKQLQKQHDIHDCFGEELLIKLAKEHTEILVIEDILNRDGWTYLDRFSKPKAHPLCTVLRDTRSQFLQTLKALNLDLEPLQDRVGRPGGGNGY